MNSPAVNLGLVLVGLVLLLGSAELLVRGGVGLARALGVSSLFIGLTVVAFGTSAPELATGISAVLHGSPGLSFGNVIGSNIVNVGLVLGATAIIAPIRCTAHAVQREVPVAIGASLLLVLFALSGRTIERWEGGVLLIGLTASVAAGYAQSRRSSATDKRRDRALERELEAEFDVGRHPSLRACAALAVLGLAGIAIGASLFIDGARDLGKMLGISEHLMGLLAIAIGTSLPELATSLVAAMRRQPDIVIGNVLGSCVFNILGVMGVTALITPLDTPPLAATRDLWVMLVFALICLPVMRSGYVIRRWEGALLLVMYVGYAVAAAAWTG